MANGPDGRALNNVFVAQDTGGAIKGDVRADVYFGFDARAAALAGNMKSDGAMFALLPRALADRVAP